MRQRALRQEEGETNYGAMRLCERARALLYIIYNINNLHQSVMTYVGIGR